MKILNTILITLLITTTLAAATERNALWTYGGAFDPYNLEVIFEFDEPIYEARYGTAYDDGHLWHRTLEPDVLNYYYKVNFEGEVITSFPGPDVMHDGSRGIDVDVDGNLWISYNLHIYHVTDEGYVIPPNPFPIEGGMDIAWDGEYIWTVGSGGGITIHKYDVNTGTLLDVWSGFWGEDPRYPSLAADADYLYLTYENKYDYEPPGYYWVLRKDGSTEFLLENGYRLNGWDVAEHSFTYIEPASLGIIKAYFK
jgi:hypothetical protein